MAGSENKEENKTASNPILNPWGNKAKANKANTIKLAMLQILKAIFII